MSICMDIYVWCGPVCANVYMHVVRTRDGRCSTSKVNKQRRVHRREHACLEVLYVYTHFFLVCFCACVRLNMSGSYVFVNACICKNITSKHMIYSSGCLRTER